MSTTEVIPLGPVAVAARTWQRRGRRLLTAIVKATFELRQDAAMAIARPVPIVLDERFANKNPVASLARASDLALVVARPEVVIVGSAYAGPGRRVSSTSVRLAVQRGTTMLISKRLDVFGARRGPPGAPPPDAALFDRIPIQYERALGGMSSRENPVGCGMSPDGDGLVSHPNIVLPSTGGVAPAGFGPISSLWPARQMRRGSMPRAAANLQLDSVDVPDDFDDGYFQVAPADQRTAELTGGEVIALVNMHPEIPQLRVYIPQLRGAALAQTARGERLPIPLRIDTVHVEPDAMRAEIVFRGVLALEARHVEGPLRVAGGVEAADKPLAFPDLSTLAATPRAPGPPAGAAAPDFGGTMLIDAGPKQQDEPPRALPFTGGANPQPRPPAHRVPSAVPFAPAPAAVRPHSGTMLIEPDLPPPKHLAPPPAPHVPRHGAAPPPAAAPPQPHNRTMLLESEISSPGSMPFAKRRRRSSKEMLAVKPTHGTPWAGAGKPAKAAPVAADDPLLQTLDLPASTAAASRSEKAAPPPAPPAPDEEAPAAVRKNPWREDPPEPEAPKEAPLAPKAPPRANFKDSVFKKIKR